VSYPGSTPELRVLAKVDGTMTLQVRYVHKVVGYVGKWQDVPVVKESDESCKSCA
jgi:hypothetical protein